MENALIVSCTKENAGFFTGMLNEIMVNNITILNTARETRRLIMDRDVDLVIIDSSPNDESGESLSRHIASKSWSQVILAAENEEFDAVSAACADDGILVIAKPVNREVFRSALILAKSAGNRIKRMQAENVQLKKKIEDIRVIDRAKCLLISYLNLSEHEAHRFIEKQAMDLRSSKRAIAEGVLKTYAS